MTPLEDQLSRARCWIAWFMGGLRVSRDYLEVGEQLRRLYVELSRLHSTRERAELALSSGWSWSEAQLAPASHDELFACWVAREHLPCRNLAEMSAHVGALVLLCFEGRAPKAEALDLGALWTAPGQLLTGRGVLNPPRTPTRRGDA
jgi:hypothetical protein